MNFDEFTKKIRDEQLINYFKYLRELAESFIIDNDFEILRFDTPGSTFVYLNFLKKFIDKSLSEQISKARKKITPSNARCLSKVVTDFNNILLKNENYDFDKYSYLKIYNDKLLEGLQESRR